MNGASLCVMTEGLKQTRIERCGKTKKQRAVMACCLSFYWRCESDLNRRMAALQAAALPLRHRTVSGIAPVKSNPTLSGRG